MAVDLLSTEVVAVIVAMTGVESGAPEPRVLAIGAPGGVPSLPSGPLLAGHRSLQAGLRDWVESQTGLRLGYVEQLYTFADRERTGSHTRVISVSYLGLTRPEELAPEGATWRDWYDLLPWEDRRDGPRPIEDRLREGLAAWARAAADPGIAEDRRARIRLAFGDAERLWHPEECLQRYELAWEAGLLAESTRPARAGAPPAQAGMAAAQGVTSTHDGATPALDQGQDQAPDGDYGERMLHDHRRIAATGLARLRAKIQYRPVVFELMPVEFTLGHLQDVVEALTGTRVHKQNFRRLVESEELVEDTGRRTRETGGRPAKLVRFRGEILTERAAAGVRLPQTRGHLS